MWKLESGNHDQLLSSDYKWDVQTLKVRKEKKEKKSQNSKCTQKSCRTGTTYCSCWSAEEIQSEAAEWISNSIFGERESGVTETCYPKQTQESPTSLKWVGKTSSKRHPRLKTVSLSPINEIKKKWPSELTNPFSSALKSRSSSMSSCSLSRNWKHVYLWISSLLDENTRSNLTRKE